MKPSLARLAFLTTPAPGVFVLNFQFGDPDLMQIEISKAQLSNILITGTDLALRESSVFTRVPETASKTENANERTGAQRPTTVDS